MKEDAARLRIKELREEVEKGRYDEFAFIKDGGFLLINFLAFTDYIKHRNRLREKNLRNEVPAYNPKKIAQAIGWYEEVC